MGTTASVALVTGAAQGIGAAVARALAGRASIAALDMNETGRTRCASMSRPWCCAWSSRRKAG